MENSIIDKLKQNPLLHMSLGSKELFHSNFLAWMLGMPNQKEFALCVLNNFPLIGNKITAIIPEREKQHMDLTLELEFENEKKKKIIIENKVKSLPNKAQLDKYKKEHTADFYFLLTLVKPNFISDGWQTITYGELSDIIEKNIDKIAPSQDSTMENTFLIFVKLYKEFISSLQTLTEDHILIKKDEKFDYNDNKNVISKQLKSIRINDIYLKLKYDSITQEINQKIKKGIENSVLLNLKEGDPFNNKNSENLENVYKISTGFSRAQAMVDFKYVLKSFKVNNLYNYVILGIQLQGNQLRYVCEIVGSINKSADIANKFAEKFYKDKLWLRCPNKEFYMPDLIVKEEDRNLGKGRKKTEETKETEENFPSYSNNFFYKYDLISSEAKTEDLVEFIYKLIKYLVQNRELFTNEFEAIN